jgi:hypothetical protein
MRILLLPALLFAFTSYAQHSDFVAAYPHTRWISKGRHKVQVDAYADHLLIAERGKPTINVRGCWKGRSFFKDCDVDYFGVAYEGQDGGFSPPSPLEKFEFKRVKPDPKT